jgi:beta-galactosidase/beta-glucuronidase
LQIGRVNAELKPGLEQTIRIPQARLWSPDDPYLYTVNLTAGEDAVQSYFGLRKIEVRDVNDTKQIFLNSHQIFQIGTLDQGYWPDGIMIPPTDAAIVWDIEQNRAHGLNLIRKHAKRESSRWYYHCDRLGMLVWQDAVSTVPSQGRERQGENKPRGQAQKARGFVRRGVHGVVRY